MKSGEFSEDMSTYATDCGLYLNIIAMGTMDRRPRFTNKAPTFSVNRVGDGRGRRAVTVFICMFMCRGCVALPMTADMTWTMTYVSMLFPVPVRWSCSFIATWEGFNALIYSMLLSKLLLGGRGQAFVFFFFALTLQHQLCIL